MFIKGAPNFQTKFWFDQFIVRPLQHANTSESGLNTLRKLTKMFILRRTKTQKVMGKKILELPNFDVQTLVIELAPIHQLYYNKILNE